MTNLVTQLPPAELKIMLDAKQPLCLLDVREGWERDIAAIPGSVHIPLAEVQARYRELDPAAQVVVMCKAGGRSQMAAQFLASQGFSRVANLSGGINGWSRDVDQSVPIY
jgi:adenylyltransferase/sulfurtransferase